MSILSSLYIIFLFYIYSLLINYYNYIINYFLFTNSRFSPAWLAIHILSLLSIINYFLPVCRSYPLYILSSFFISLINYYLIRTNTRFSAACRLAIFLLLSMYVPIWVCVCVCVCMYVSYVCVLCMCVHVMYMMYVCHVRVWSMTPDDDIY
jgi:hypothetical protein